MTDATPRELNLGPRIRKHREEAGISVAELAGLAGLPPTTLADIEEGRRAPLVADLLNLADALAVSPGHLIQPQEASERIEVVRADERWHVDRGASATQPGSPYRYEALSTRVPNKLMQPFVVELRATAEPHVSQHAGEEFLYVLSGKVALDIKGQTHELAAGDSVYFDSSQPHALRPLSAQAPRLIAVVALGASRRAGGELQRAF